MRIHGIQRRPEPSKASRKSRETGSFLTLLQTKMEEIQAMDSRQVSPANDGKLWDVVEDAARLLDIALEQLTAGAKPDQEILSQLQKMQVYFHDYAARDRNLREVDLLLTVEHQRMMNM